MNLKTRLKLALNVFINPPITELLMGQELSPNLAPKPTIVWDNKLLAGKNVLVTGAGRNIGRSIALEMAKQGANIYFTDINQERCIKLTQELKEYNIDSRFFISDICNSKNIEELCQSLLQDKIKIDILVNNIGINSEVKGIKNLEIAEWQKIFNTNLFGAMYLTKLISEIMTSNQIQGSIIFITSIHQFTLFRRPSYSASKAALGMAIEELAIDLAPDGIRVNGIAPGAILEDEQENPLIHPHTPLYKTTINPRYIGRAAVYLASDYFSLFTTGTVLKIDAGLSLCNHLCTEDF